MNAVLHLLYIIIQVVLHGQTTDISALFYEHLIYHEYRSKTSQQHFFTKCNHRRVLIHLAIKILILLRAKA